MTLIEAIAMIPVGHYLRIEQTDCAETGKPIFQALIYQEVPVTEHDALSDRAIFARSDRAVGGTSTDINAEIFERAIVEMIKLRFAPAACPLPARSGA